MTELLARLFIKDHKNTRHPAVRRAYGTLCAIVGILLNVVLFAIKLVAGTLSGSLSIRADAMNNLSDAGSSVISLVSFKISAKPADHDHPFGHARIEYVASMIVSFLIMLIGVELCKGAFEKFLAPLVPVFHPLTVAILCISVLIKLWLCLFNRRVGKRISSDVLRATAADSLSDAASTGAVLLATLLAPVLPQHIGAYVDPVMSVLVSVLIFVAGIRILNDTKNSILGERADHETVEKIAAVVAEYPEALGIHDMILHNYGPGRCFASLHVEVDGKKDVFETHDTIDLIERRVQRECGIECTIHLDPIVVDDPCTNAWRERLPQIAAQIDSRICVHDFRMVPGHTHTTLILDVAVPFEVALSDSEIKAQLAARIAADYTVECIKETANDKAHWYGARFEPVLGKLIEMLK